MADKPVIHAIGAEGLTNILSSLSQPPTGGSSGGLEARVAKLEAAIEHIQTDVREIKLDIREIKSDAKTDFRILFGAIIVATLGLAGLMARGFQWL